MNQTFGLTGGFAGQIFAQVDGTATPSADGGAAGGTTTTVPVKGDAPAAPGGMFGGGQFNGLFMIAIMFVVFYLLLIRPQQKKAKEHQKMLDGIGQGAEIVTNGGLVGRVIGVKGSVLTLEVAEKIRVRVLRSQVAGLFEEINKSDASAERKSEKK